MDLAMIGDRIVPFDTLDPLYLDRGTFFGDGVYEVLRSYNGRLFALEEHLERFKRSLDAVLITGIDMDTVRKRVVEAFEQAGMPNARIYFHVTRGSERRNHGWTTDLKPNFFLTVTDAPDSSADKEKGISVCTHPDWRWKRCDIKSLNLLANVLAKQDAENRGCSESILVDEAGVITEGSSSAFFVIFGRALHTAPLTSNILPSITRQFVVKAAANVDLELVEQSLTPDQAKEADEIFIAVTTKDIIPVVKFEEKTISDNKPGPVTKALIEEFRKFTMPQD